MVHVISPPADIKSTGSGTTGKSRMYCHRLNIISTSYAIIFISLKAIILCAILQNLVFHIILFTNFKTLLLLFFFFYIEQSVVYVCLKSVFNVCNKRVQLKSITAHSTEDEK
jgi:hypothetical protein